MFHSGTFFLVFLTKRSSKCLIPWNFPKISGCAPVLRHYSFCKTFQLKCLTVFWIRLYLNSWSVTLYSNYQWPYAMYCIRHIQNSGIFRYLFIHVYSGIFSHIHAYWGEALLRYIQTYSGIFNTLSNSCIFPSWESQPCHIPSLGLFGTERHI